MSDFRIGSEAPKDGRCVLGVRRPENQPGRDYGSGALHLMEVV
jgi:hypothetical protein